MASLNKQFINVPKVSVPFTTIVNRAKIPDLSKDLGVRMGVERHQLKGLYRISDEQGPNGEPVYGIEGDELGFTRAIGNWESLAFSYGNGIGQTDISTIHTIEIHFKGTGLNMMATTYPNQRLMTVVIDNISYPNVDWQFSDVLGNRNYSKNVIQNVAIGLADIPHTAHISFTLGGSAEVFGYEVLNENTQLTISPGESQINDAIISTLTQSNLSYNSGFESGVLGTRGGRVAVYQKIDGTIGHAVNPVGVQKNLALADFSNSEISRDYHWREFGAGRVEDFSTLANVVSNRAFTLEDGTTTLTGNGIIENLGGVNVQTNTTGFATITFVGTGLSIKLRDTAVGSNTNANSLEYLTDGSSIGFHEQTSIFGVRIKNIVSGLPYGTHKIKFQRNLPSLFNFDLLNFIVYQPKTPTIPTNAQLLGTYNILADYVPNAIVGKDYISSGVIRKAVSREILYSGTWTIDGAPNNLDSQAGFNTYSPTNGGYLEYTFFGTGFEIKTTSQVLYSNSVAVTLNGTPASIANFPTLATSIVNGFTYNTATAVMNLSFNTGLAGGTVSISGLPLSKYTVRLTNQTASRMLYSALDIITPIYSPIQSNNSKQSAIEVGNNSIADHRSLSEFSNVVKKPNIVKALGVSLNPSVTSTLFIPMPDMSAVIAIKKQGFLSIVFEASVFGSGINSNSQFFSIYLDGISVRPEATRAMTQPGHTGVVVIKTVEPVNKGVHHVMVLWRVDGQTFSNNGFKRALILEEL